MEPPWPWRNGRSSRLGGFLTGSFSRRTQVVGLLIFVDTPKCLDDGVAIQTRDWDISHVVAHAAPGKTHCQLFVSTHEQEVLRFADGSERGISARESLDVSDGRMS